MLERLQIKVNESISIAHVGKPRKSFSETALNRFKSINQNNIRRRPDRRRILDQRSDVGFKRTDQINIISRQKTPKNVR